MNLVGQKPVSTNKSANIFASEDQHDKKSRKFVRVIESVGGDRVEGDREPRTTISKPRLDDQTKLQAASVATQSFVSNGHCPFKTVQSSLVILCGFDSCSRSLFISTIERKSCVKFVYCSLSYIVSVLQPLEIGSVGGTCQLQISLRILCSDEMCDFGLVYCRLLMWHFSALLKDDIELIWLQCLAVHLVNWEAVGSRIECFDQEKFSLTSIVFLGRIYLHPIAIGSQH